jgi:hypothetical protein
MNLTLFDEFVHKSMENISRVLTVDNDLHDVAIVRETM